VGPAPSPVIAVAAKRHERPERLGWAGRIQDEDEDENGECLSRRRQDLQTPVSGLQSAEAPKGLNVGSQGRSPWERSGKNVDPEGVEPPINPLLHEMSKAEALSSGQTRVVFDPFRVEHRSVCSGGCGLRPDPRLLLLSPSGAEEKCQTAGGPDLETKRLARALVPHPRGVRSLEVLAQTGQTFFVFFFLFPFIFSR
jgi:hypothetical protein